MLAPLRVGRAARLSPRSHVARLGQLCFLQLRTLLDRGFGGSARRFGHHLLPQCELNMELLSPF